MIRAVQAPIQSPPPDPAWLGDAVGGIISAAILGLPFFAWTNRQRWFGRAAGALWLVCVLIVLYYLTRGQGLLFVPDLLLRAVPAWKALAIGFLLGAGPAWLSYAMFVRKSRRFGRQHAAEPVVAPPPVPVTVAPQSPPTEAKVERPPNRNRVFDGIWTPGEYFTAWKSLAEDERSVMRTLWNDPSLEMTQKELESHFLEWTPAQWNHAIYALEERHHFIEAIRVMRNEALVSGWHFTPEGKAIVHANTRSENEATSPLRDEWLAQAERFERLRGHVYGAWDRDEENRVTWEIAPMAGSSPHDLEAFKAQALLAGGILGRAGVVAGPRPDPLIDWYDAVRALTDSNRDAVTSSTRDGRTLTGKVIDDMERRSALACTKLAGGARPSW